MVALEDLEGLLPCAAFSARIADDLSHKYHVFSWRPGIEVKATVVQKIPTTMEWGEYFVLVDSLDIGKIMFLDSRPITTSIPGNASSSKFVLRKLGMVNT